MDIILRIILVAGSIGLFLLCIIKIKQAKMKVTHSMTWMCGSIILILMGIFTDAVGWISYQLGFLSPSNFVFMIVIAYLLFQAFIDNIRISALNEKIKDLNHHIALKEYEQKEEEE